MALSPDWAGHMYGTNTGNVFLRLQEGAVGELNGILRVNDDRLGITVYTISGTFDGSHLRFTGSPSEVPGDVTAGEITAGGILNAKGEVEGDWASTIGSAGKFVLFPHRRLKSEPGPPDQLHIARHDLRPIAVSKSELEEIADLVQKDFDNPVVVTVTGETEQSS